MGDVVYTSRVRVERVRGRHRRAEVPGGSEPVEIGVHGAIAAHYGVEPGSEPERTATLDYLVAAAAG
jgi:hypothetical protein